MDSCIGVVSKSPDECSDAEVADFIALVRAGSEVPQRGLERRTRRAFRLGFLHSGNCLLSIAALKCPEQSDRSRVERSSGVALPAMKYPYELGWVYTLSSARGKRYGQRVSEFVVTEAHAHGIFATSRTDNGAMQIPLERLGFSLAGLPYESQRGKYQLQLFVRL